MIPPDAIQPARIQYLNDKDVRPGPYVLYWMQQSQRAEENHALEYAIERANALRLGVVVAFGLTDDYPEANHRHMEFMLEGLRETQGRLTRRGIKMVVRRGSPVGVAAALAGQAALVVCDRGYLRHQKAWREELARTIDCPLVQIESDVVVPIEVTSQKAEYAARTIRPKIHRHLDDYLVPLPECSIKHPSLNLPIDGIDLASIDRVLGSMRLDRTVPPVLDFFAGGTSIAKAKFNTFLAERFERYVENRNQPQTNDISHMSPYLHFGQVSPISLAMAIRALSDQLPEAGATYLEELIVRRELAMNFVHFTRDYDNFSCLPNWAAKTLDDHAGDPRAPRYDREELEAAETHDPYWNAAMREMKISGFMHNYMRMYWGKKILEWSATPREAFQTTLALNNKFFLDGRDGNSFTGVAWVFGVHDRPWFERPIFGKIRYMAASGLERKCRIMEYAAKIDAMESRRSFETTPNGVK